MDQLRHDNKTELTLADAPAAQPTKIEKPAEFPPLSEQSPTVYVVVRDHFTQDIRPNYFAEFQLLILTFCTGIQDATSFPDYHCFASNQTGNTVFLCLALILPELNGKMFITSNIAVALGLFLGAGCLTGQISHHIGPRRRWWLLFCNLVQSFLVLGAAAIQYWHGIEESGPRALAVIGLLAFASGSQVVQSRSLSMPEISTAMATAAWVDLTIDQHLCTFHNRSRDRRALFLLALVAGALSGAGIYKTAGSAAAIAVSGFGKLAVSLLYLFSEAENSQKNDSVV